MYQPEHILTRKTGILSVVIALLLFVTGCNTRDLQEQILMMNGKQALLMNERDSLLKLLDQKVTALDTMKSDMGRLSSDLAAAEARNRALQSGSYKSSQELKKALSENEQLRKRIEEREARNDSLLNEINRLRERITVINREMETSRKTSEALAEVIRQQEEKRKADSLAQANKPKEPVVKESGFVNITQVGGGIGLANTSVEYSRSLISVNNIFGYEVNRHFIIGAGLGVNFYNGGTMVSLYTHLRYSFRGDKITPFLSGDGGVLLTPEDVGSSGLFVNPMFGLSKKLNTRLSLHVSTGLLIQMAPAGMRNSFINLKGGLDFRPKR